MSNAHKPTGPDTECERIFQAKAEFDDLTRNGADLQHVLLKGASMFGLAKPSVQRIEGTARGTCEDTNEQCRLAADLALKEAAFAGDERAIAVLTAWALRDHRSAIVQLRKWVGEINVCPKPRSDEEREEQQELVLRSELEKARALVEHLVEKPPCACDLTICVSLHRLKAFRGSDQKRRTQSLQSFVRRALLGEYVTKWAKSFVTGMIYQDLYYDVELNHGEALQCGGDLKSFRCNERCECLIGDSVHAIRIQCKQDHLVSPDEVHLPVKFWVFRKDAYKEVAKEPKSCSSGAGLVFGYGRRCSVLHCGARLTALDKERRLSIYVKATEQVYSDWLSPSVASQTEDYDTIPRDTPVEGEAGESDYVAADRRASGQLHRKFAVGEELWAEFAGNRQLPNPLAYGAYLLIEWYSPVNGALLNSGRPDVTSWLDREIVRMLGPNMEAITWVSLTFQQIAILYDVVGGRRGRSAIAQASPRGPTDAQIAECVSRYWPQILGKCGVAKSKPAPRTDTLRKFLHRLISSFHEFICGES